MYENMRFQAVVDQAKIHRMAWSEDLKKRREAAEQIRDNFADLRDKNRHGMTCIGLLSILIGICAGVLHMRLEV